MFFSLHKDVCEAGWSFYNGSCYFTSETCETWSNASTICRNTGANLPAIETQEENVYIQHRHNGDKAWIGLNDIATEGLFSWVDGCPDKFRYWADKQPNDFFLRLPSSDHLSRFPNRENKKNRRQEK